MSWPIFAGALLCLAVAGVLIVLKARKVVR